MRRLRRRNTTEKRKTLAVLAGASILILTIVLVAMLMTALKMAGITKNDQSFAANDPSVQDPSVQEEMPEENPGPERDAALVVTDPKPEEAPESLPWQPDVPAEPRPDEPDPNAEQEEFDESDVIVEETVQKEEKEPSGSDDIIPVIVAPVVAPGSQKDNQANIPTVPAVEEKEPEITCDKFAIYTGTFVEDGRDEQVENVAAVLITNQTDHFLELADVTCTIDGEPAYFLVTGLPAGRSAWVMEAGRRSVTDESDFVVVDIVTSFKEGVISQTDKLSLTASGNLLTAENKSGSKLEDVFVYYRTLHTDGNFFGGITYRVDFGTLEPGSALEKLAGHYKEGTTEIVRIGWKEG